jgi:hypothetical protein
VRYNQRLNLLMPAVVGLAVAMATMSFVGRARAQGPTMFPTPDGRYYNSYRSGPYGSYSQGIGGAYSQGTPNMFDRGLPPMVNNGPVNLYQNQPYGGRFYFQPMVGPAYDPFRNGR